MNGYKVGMGIFIRKQRAEQKNEARFGFGSYQLSKRILSLEPKTKTEPELRTKWLPNHNILLSKILKIIRIIQVLSKNPKKWDNQSELIRIF